MKLRLTAAPHSTPLGIEVSEDGRRWTALIARRHMIPVNSRVLAAYRMPDGSGTPPRMRP